MDNRNPLCRQNKKKCHEVKNTSKSLSTSNLHYDVKKFVISKILHDVKKFVMMSKIFPDVKTFFVTLQSSSWRQKVRQDVKNTS